MRFTDIMPIPSASTFESAIFFINDRNHILPVHLYIQKFSVDCMKWPEHTPWDQTWIRPREMATHVYTQDVNTCLCRWIQLLEVWDKQCSEYTRIISWWVFGCISDNSREEIHLLIAIVQHAKSMPTKLYIRCQCYKHAENMPDSNTSLLISMQWACTMQLLMVPIESKVYWRSTYLYLVYIFLYKDILSLEHFVSCPK